MYCQNNYSIYVLNEVTDIYGKISVDMSHSGVGKEVETSLAASGRLPIVTEHGHKKWQPYIS